LHQFTLNDPPHTCTHTCTHAHTHAYTHAHAHVHAHTHSSGRLWTGYGPVAETFNRQHTTISNYLHGCESRKQVVITLRGYISWKIFNALSIHPSIHTHTHTHTTHARALLLPTANPFHCRNYSWYRRNISQLKHD
jgi:hypothetical protein